MTRGTISTPKPQGMYVSARRHADLIFTAGMTPRQNGKLMVEGPIIAGKPVDAWRDAVVLACSNALASATAALREGETLDQILSMTVFLVAEPAFTAHSRIADFASQYLTENLDEAGACARTAIGVATLPGNAPVEINLIASVRTKKGQMP